MFFFFPPGAKDARSETIREERRTYCIQTAQRGEQYFVIHVHFDKVTELLTLVLKVRGEA